MAVKIGMWRLLGLSIVLTYLVGQGGLAVARSSIRIVSPRSGTALKGNAVIQVLADAPEIAYVILGIDKERACSMNSQPYNFNLDTSELSDGSHLLYAEAYSRVGLLSRSPLVKVRIKNAVGRPAPAVPVSQEAAVVKAPKSAEGERLRDLGSSALISRAAGADLQSGAQTEALSAEPPVNPETLSLPAAQISLARSTTVTAIPVAASTNALSPTASKPTAVSSPVEHPSILVNGKPLTSDVPASLTEAGHQVGFRALMTRAGWRVDWIASKRMGIATRNGHRIEIALNSKQAIMDGASKSLGMEVKMVSNRLMVSLRPVCQMAGISVDWNPTTYTAQLAAPEALATPGALAANPAAPEVLAINKAAFP